MDRNDFVRGDSWCRYKFERESYIEEIQKLESQRDNISKEVNDAMKYWFVTMVILVVCAVYKAFF